MKIAISGKMYSGKTSLANALIEQGDYDPFYVARLGFADPLRRGLQAMGVKKGSPLFRELAQCIGNDIIRYHYPDWWVGQLDTMYQTAEEHKWAQFYVIDDVRYPNELEWCELNGFFTVRLDVTSQTQIERGADLSRVYHESERALDRIPESRYGLWIPEYIPLEERVAAVLQGVADAAAYEQQTFA